VQITTHAAPHYKIFFLLCTINLLVLSAWVLNSFRTHTTT